MVTFNNLLNNPNILTAAQLGGMRVLEYEKDLSVRPDNAISSYYASEMNVRRRQLLLELKGDSYVVQAGAMQWMSGAVEATSGIKGVGDLLGKALASKATKESAVKPEYKGTGHLMLEPTYKHIILLDVGQWDGLVLDDGLFLACSGSVQQKVVARSNLSSAVLGNEGLFNLCLRGAGVAGGNARPKGQRAGKTCREGGVDSLRIRADKQRSFPRRAGFARRACRGELLARSVLHKFFRVKNDLCVAHERPSAQIIASRRATINEERIKVP